MPTYLACIKNPNHRFCSWDYCYSYFYNNRGEALLGDNLERSCLSLGMYLASWGMYRGSGPLLQHSHHIYIPVIGWIRDQHFTRPWLWCFNFCNANEDCLKALIVACEELKDILSSGFSALSSTDAIEANVSSTEREPTDTLISKIMLGVFGCMPALDLYFTRGAGVETSINLDNLKKIQSLCKELCTEMSEYTGLFVKDFNSGLDSKIKYPCAKIVDMYFWEKGKRLKSHE